MLYWMRLASPPLGNFNDGDSNGNENVKISMGFYKQNNNLQHVFW